MIEHHVNMSPEEAISSAVRVFRRAGFHMEPPTHRGALEVTARLPVTVLSLLARPRPHRVRVKAVTVSDGARVLVDLRRSVSYVAIARVLAVAYLGVYMWRFAIATSQARGPGGVTLWSLVPLLCLVPFSVWCFALLSSDSRGAADRVSTSLRAEWLSRGGLPRRTDRGLPSRGQVEGLLFVAAFVIASVWVGSSSWMASKSGERLIFAAILMGVAAVILIPCGMALVMFVRARAVAERCAPMLSGVRTAFSMCMFQMTPCMFVCIGLLYGDRWEAIVNPDPKWSYILWSSCVFPWCLGMYLFTGGLRLASISKGLESDQHGRRHDTAIVAASGDAVVVRRARWSFGMCGVSLGLLALSLFGLNVACAVGWFVHGSLGVPGAVVEHSIALLNPDLGRFSRRIWSSIVWLFWLAPTALLFAIGVGHAVALRWRVHALRSSDTPASGVDAWGQALVDLRAEWPRAPLARLIVREGSAIEAIPNLFTREGGLIVVCPEVGQRLTEVQRKAILTHELAHLERDSEARCLAWLHVLGRATFVGDSFMNVLVHTHAHEARADVQAQSLFGSELASALRIMQRLSPGTATGTGAMLMRVEANHHDSTSQRSWWLRVARVFSPWWTQYVGGSRSGYWHPEESSRMRMASTDACIQVSGVDHEQRTAE